MGVPAAHSEITKVLGIEPTECHTTSDIHPRTHKPWINDIWSIDSPLPRAADFDEHLKWLADLIRPHEAFLRGLSARGARMDLYCGYMTDSIHSGFVVSAESLRLFTSLGIAFGVSVMILEEASNKVTGANAG